MGTTEAIIVSGRPDLDDMAFGVTPLRRFPEFVYSLLGGMLVHRIARVEARWYEPTQRGDALRRLSVPSVVAYAVCGQYFYFNHWRGKVRARACVAPRDGAVLCGRCAGNGPVFRRGIDAAAELRREARARIGCQES